MRRKKRLFKKTFPIFIGLFFLFFGLVLIWISSFKIPDLKTFDDRKVEQSTKIYDRTGEVLLYDLHQDIKRSLVSYDEISKHIKNATVAIEDAEFYQHRGIKPTAFIRALLTNIRTLEFSQGGSTITQQVIKNSVLTSEKKISRKIKEWVLALKLEKQFTKDEILSFYLNEVPYGGSIYGIEEASQSFFRKSAKDVSLAEAAYLAALPQAPTFFSPYRNNKDRLEGRKNLVLLKMLEWGFINEEEYTEAKEEVVEFQPREDLGIKAPHFVFWVIESLEQRFGKSALEENGFRIITTLDYSLQTKAEEIVKKFALENQEKYNAENASLVAIDPQTGEVLVMVGSRDYFDEDIEGNFNIALAKRQPGSAFKPFVYATAFSKGYTPETVVFDVRTQFSTTCNAQGTPYQGYSKESCYIPVNYDNIYRGPVTLREALAQSINVPSIKALYLSGLQDSLQTAERMGITTLTDISRYGLTLVLGGGEVSLLDITSAYSVFANEGKRNPYNSILRIETLDGEIVEEKRSGEVRVIDENVSLMISDILSDNVARAPAFGTNSLLYFPNNDVAVKTGTTNDYKDAWIVGYTPQIAVGAWAGNNDNSPMEKKIAGFIVAPLWNAFMKEVLDKYGNEPFRGVRKENQMGLPGVLRGVWQGGESFFIDKISGKLATEFTPEELKQEVFIQNVHNILYWIDKKNPRGGIPKNPQEDSQFLLWEDPVRAWVKNNNIIESTVVPTELDNIHRPEFQPVFNLILQEKNSYSQSEKILIGIIQTGGNSISKSDLYVNGLLVSTKDGLNNHFFIPKDLGISSGPAEIKVVAYDSVLNKGVSIKNIIISE